MPTKHRLVAVEWVDSSGWGGWVGSPEVLEKPNPLQCSSIGILVDKKRDHITLAGTWDEQDPVRINGPISIPRGCIKSMRGIRWPRMSKTPWNKTRQK